MDKIKEMEKLARNAGYGEYFFIGVLHGTPVATPTPIQRAFVRGVRSEPNQPLKTPIQCVIAVHGEIASLTDSLRSREGDKELVSILKQMLAALEPKKKGIDHAKK